MVFENAAELKNFIGRELGPTDWLIVTQEMINQFADATHDHQWIHVDPEKAAKLSPTKKTMAHGFLALSLLTYFMLELVDIKNVKMFINYGFEKVRFTAPVPVDSRLRLSAKLKSVEDFGSKAKKATWICTVELEGSKKPACHAEWIGLVF